MLSEGLYTFSELQAIIKESNEFTPKMGNNVVKDNAKAIPITCNGIDINANVSFSKNTLSIAGFIK